MTCVICAIDAPDSTPVCAACQDDYRAEIAAMASAVKRDAEEISATGVSFAPVHGSVSGATQKCHNQPPDQTLGE